MVRACKKRVMCWIPMGVGNAEGGINWTKQWKTQNWKMGEWEDKDLVQRMKAPWAVENLHTSTYSEK